MKTRPIFFNTEMVQAILSGRKIQTRRVVKYRKGEIEGVPIWAGDPSKYEDGSYKFWFNVVDSARKLKHPNNPASYSTVDIINPPYEVGDILYVRETWNHGYIETSDSEGSHESWFEPTSVDRQGYLKANAIKE